MSIRVTSAKPHVTCTNKHTTTPTASAVDHYTYVPKTCAKLNFTILTSQHFTISRVDVLLTALCMYKLQNKKVTREEGSREF